MVLKINKRISKIQSFANMVVRSGLKCYFLVIQAYTELYRFQYTGLLSGGVRRLHLSIITMYYQTWITSYR